MDVNYHTYRIIALRSPGGYLWVRRRDNMVVVLGRQSDSD